MLSVMSVCRGFWRRRYQPETFAEQIYPGTEHEDSANDNAENDKLYFDAGVVVIVDLLLI